MHAPHLESDARKQTTKTFKCSVSASEVAEAAPPYTHKIRSSAHSAGRVFRSAATGSSIWQTNTAVTPAVRDGSRKRPEDRTAHPLQLNGAPQPQKEHPHCSHGGKIKETNPATLIMCVCDGPHALHQNSHELHARAAGQDGARPRTAAPARLP